MPKFEYSFRTFGPAGVVIMVGAGSFVSDENYEETMNRMGAERWESYAITIHKQFYTHYFKRQIYDNPGVP